MEAPALAGLCRRHQNGCRDSERAVDHYPVRGAASDRRRRTANKHALGASLRVAIALQQPQNARDRSLKRFNLMSSPSDRPVHHLAEFRQISFILSSPWE